MLKSSKGEEVMLSYKLDFPCLNNEAEYKTFILGMLAALELGIRRLKMIADFDLII